MADSQVDAYEVRPIAGPLDAIVRPPGSKSLTNRALPIAAFAHGESRLRNVLDGDDTRAMVAALENLGITIGIDWPAKSATVRGCAGRPSAAKANLYLNNSGTSIRFLAAVLAATPGNYRLDGNARMRQRPIGDLIAALQSLGVVVRSAGEDGFPPIEISGGTITRQRVAVRGDVSSQFLSGLLLMAPLVSHPVTIAIEGGLVSAPYVEMTLAVMAAFEAGCERPTPTEYHFQGGGYRAADYAIEPDASSASYFFAAAAIVGGKVTVPGLGSGSVQGDLQFVRTLERMGCRVDLTGDRTVVERTGPLVGVDVDMRDISDTAMTLAAVACFARGNTRIRNIKHIRHKESDRLAALATELRKAGQEIVEYSDGLEISPRKLKPAMFATYDDHRLAMSLALLGLKQAGIVVLDPACTTKTYPNFWKDLAALG